MLSNCIFPFGGRLFIGIIKFYNKEKEFGFIVANNLGMKNDKRFIASTQNFYIGKDSFIELPKLGRLVVFQPAIFNGKLKAINVRQYEIERDRDLALAYYNRKNFIYYIDKERIHSGYNTEEYIEKKHCISILKLSGIYRYELIYDYCEEYKEKGSEAILLGLSKLVYSAGGEEEYYRTLKSNYDNKGKELEAINYMFSILDAEVSCKIVLQHPSLQSFAPTSLLLEIAGDLNPDYGIPIGCKQKYNICKLEKILSEKKTFECYYTEEEKRKKLHNYYLPETEFTSLLHSCSEDIRPIYLQKIYEQMHDGVNSFICTIQNETKKSKKIFLLIYGDFIDKQQEDIIKRSIDDDIINEIEKQISRALESKCSIEWFETYAIIISNDYFGNNTYIQENVKEDIIKSVIQIVHQIMTNFSLNEYSLRNHGTYLKIKKIIESNKFIKETCIEPVKNVVKEEFRILFRNLVFDGIYDSFFIKDFKEVFDNKEQKELVELFSDEILKNASLGKIYNYFHLIAGIEVPVTTKELLRTKTINEVISCGPFFSRLSDKGLSYLNDIIQIIKNNCNSNGDFIIDGAPDGERSLFVGTFISDLRREDAINNLINQLSFHDRVVLSQSKVFGFDLATKDDVRKELLNIGVCGDASHILQRLRHCSHALVEIITSTQCLTNRDINEKILWLRKYYSIQNREYIDIEERQKYEQRLLKYWEGIKKTMGFDASLHGMDFIRRQVALSYCDYKKHANFLSVIWKAATIEDSNYVVEFKKDVFKEFAKDEVERIEVIIGNHFEEIGEDIRIKVDKSDDYDLNTVLSYITVNVLNNISIDSENMELISINDPKLIKDVSSILQMTAKDYMEAFWRVGDRGDIEHYHKDVVIEFEEEPDNVVKSILLDVIPGLTIQDDAKVFEYHYSESEIASGYGRSWDWERNEEYKNCLLVEIIIRIFEAYKEGLQINIVI